MAETRIDKIIRYRQELGKKGVALFMVLATMMTVIILANVILRLISSQSRLTHHQVSRIQAYYAAQAGINYALEMLRTDAWSSPFLPSYSLNDSQFPGSIQQPVTITITPNTTLDNTDGCSAPVLGQFCISATATYTYTL